MPTQVPRLYQFKRVLSYPSTSWQLCLLAVLAGVCASAVIILFRLSFQQLQLYVVPTLGGYSELQWWVRLALPFLGVLGIYCVASLTGLEHYRLGIPYVLHRVKTQYGIIPLRTTINQFFGGIFALASGFFVGREGPSVHLGAAGTSFIGEGLKLPYNCIRILAGCGIAAGISASFNTPLAAVIFVMEVILREYRIHMFIPVMLSAAIGTVMTRAVFGEGTELLFLDFAQIEPVIMLYLVLFGIGLGALAALYNSQLMAIMKFFSSMSLRNRLLIAASITGAVGIFIPEAMGAEFEQVHRIFSTEPGIWLLLAILCAKIVLGCVAIGLGIPGGIIGPVMVIGMYAGAILAYPFEQSMGSLEYHDTFVLLGLAGMLSAVLHAPLAALTAVMELSYAPQIVLPAILVIVPAFVTSSQVFKNKSIFIRQLAFLGLPYQASSVTQTLQKTGVLALLTQPEHVFSAEELNNVSSFTYQHTLAEVYDVLKVKRSGFVFIVDPDTQQRLGIIVWEDLHAYLFKQQY